MRLFRTDDRNYSGRDGAKLHRIPATGAIEVARRQLLDNKGERITTAKQGIGIIKRKRINIQIYREKIEMKKEGTCKLYNLYMHEKWNMKKI